MLGLTYFWLGWDRFICSLRLLLGLDLGPHAEVTIHCGSGRQLRARDVDRLGFRVGRGKRGTTGGNRACCLLACSKGGHLNKGVA